MGHSRKCCSRPKQSDPYGSADDVHQDDGILSVAFDEMRDILLVDYTYDVPYLAGLSRTGQIYFRDRRIPDSFVYQGSTYSLDRYWMIHEAIEHDHMHRFGEKRQAALESRWFQQRDDSVWLPQKQSWEYQPSHQIALNEERRQVELDGIDWDWYSDWCDQWLWIGDEKPRSCPPCLDLRPYLDEIVDGDVTLLTQIADAGGPPSLVLGQPGDVFYKDGRRLV